VAVESLLVLFVVSPERFRDEELLEPLRAVQAAGHAVSVGSTRACMATGMLGARVPAASIRELAGRDWDALVIVGGSGAPDHLWASEPLLAVVRRLHAAGRPVAAICLSAAVLARAGVLAGRRATVYPSPRAVIELKRGGATYVREAVVADGPILTASGTEAAVAFGAALVQRLEP